MKWTLDGGSPEVASRVRKEMVAHLAKSAPAQLDLGDAEVIIGELLSNAIVHGGGHIAAFIRAERNDAFVTVCDEGPTFSITRPRVLHQSNALLDEHGRGMNIISALGHSAKVHCLDGCKAVTVQLAVR